MPPSGCTAAGLLQTGRRPAYAARVCKAVHTLAALLRRRSPAPIRSAYAARIRCSSPATAAMAKSRSRLSRCSFTDYADYDLAGPPPAVLELISIEKCINVSTGTVRVMRAGTTTRVRAVEKSFDSAHAAAREACTKYRAGHVIPKRKRITHKTQRVVDRYGPKKTTRVGLLFCRGGSPRPPS